MDANLEDEHDSLLDHSSHFSFRSLQTHPANGGPPTSPCAAADNTGQYGTSRSVLPSGAAPRNYHTMRSSSFTQQPIPQASGWWRGIRNIFSFGNLDESEQSVPVVAYSDDETTR